MSPREFLRAAESGAIRIRKSLAHLCARGGASWTSGSMSDAERLTALVEILSRAGQKAPAVDALRIAEYVEQLLEVLRANLDAAFTD